MQQLDCLRGLQFLGVEMGEDEIREFFREFDKDDSGEIVTFQRDFYIPFFEALN